MVVAATVAVAVTVTVTAATVTVAMGMTAAAIVGLNMFFLSDKLCQAFTRDQQVLQVSDAA